VLDASAELTSAQAGLDEATMDAEPHRARVGVAEDELRDAERRLSADRLRQRLNELQVQATSRGRDMRIAPPGR
jgi:hypothetical protein